MEEHVKTTGRIFAIGMVLVLAFVLVAACQTIDGACWLPDSQGQGGGPGGPIVPAGVGGYGDMPTGGGGYGAGYVPCPTEDDSCTMADIRCKDHVDWGQPCQFQCGTQGKYCDAQITHTTTKKPVLLYQCTGCKEDPRCWYADPDKPTDICIDRPNVPRGAEYPICKE
jgi:hypothetical protein